MRSVWILALTLSCYFKVNAQLVYFHGQISDEQGKPLSFVSIWTSTVNKGALTNEQGLYGINLKRGIYSFSFRSPGYEPVFKTIQVEGIQVNNDLRLYRPTETNGISKNADSIIWQVIKRRNSRQFPKPDYDGHLYRKALQRLNDLPKIHVKKDLAHELQINPVRKGIINFSEYISEFYSRSKDYLKEEVIALKKVNNSKDFFNFNGSPDLHVDFYQNILNFNGFNQHTFVSPIGDQAFTFYRYRLTRQFTDESRIIYEISVLPKRRDEHLFSGTIYIVDKEWRLYGIDLYLLKNAHLDFINTVHISQQFVPLNNNDWESHAMQFNFSGKFWKVKYSGLFLQVYQDINVDTTTRTGPYHEVFHITKEDYMKDQQFWEQNRPVELTSEEDHFYKVTDQAQKAKTKKELTDSLQNKNNNFRLLPYILKGYTLHNYNLNSSFSFQSPRSMVFYNTVEGWGIDLKVKYLKVIDSIHNLTLIPEARYGFSDKVLNANIFANYVYNPFRQASVYARVGSDFLDLNNTGTVSLFLNSLSTLFLGSNYLKLYQSRFVMAGTYGEVANGVLLNGLVEYADRRSLFNTTLHTFNKDSTFLTSNNPLNPYGNTPLFPHYRALILKGSATFTFDQEYEITPTGKYILPNRFPRVRVNYRVGIPALGSDVNYKFVSADFFQDRLNIGIYGYASYFLSAGTFLNAKKLYYPDYMQFRGGESFFFNSTLGSFHFLNYYTYSTDKAYFEVHLEQNFAGFFLSHVPLINKLNLQEIIGGSYLTQGILPSYTEAYIGIKRTVVRIDYGFAFGRYSNRFQGFRLVYNL
ncbi:MAG: carboxypeptidase-like regulatory protein [Mucilaginibacter sp.]|nr:carboxypeptidase-like regulatory protein [Mucilaginibacter sp.]